MNLIDRFLEQARQRPDVPAIVEARRTVTFAQLDLASQRAARLLARAGLQAGDGVLLLQPMSIALYVALLAHFRLGLVTVLLDPAAGREHIARCCHQFPLRAFIGSDKAHLLRLLSPAIRRIPLKFAIDGPVPGATSWRGAGACEPLADITPCVPETPAILTFTSGSTGRPKAALRSHGFLLAQHDALAESLALEAGEVDLTTLPVFLLANLASGLTSVIPDANLRAPGRIDPAPVIGQLRSQPITRIGASPALLERLAAYALRQGITLPGLRNIYTGGAPVFPRLLRDWQTVAPAARIFSVYGSTEAEPMAHVALDEMSAEDISAMAAGKGLLAGAPAPSVWLRILPQRWGQSIGPYSEEEFIAQCLPAGMPGEIVVSGGHVLPGYLHGEGDAETKFRVAGTPWHRTGDAGYLDARGRLWLLGRCAARIDDDRGTLFPFTVECAAGEYPAVRRATAVAHRGKRLLVVELHPKHLGTELSSLQAGLAWAQLDEIRLVKRIPVDTRHNAKIDYPTLALLLDQTDRSTRSAREDCSKVLNI